jgi:hypothetical protein
VEDRSTGCHSKHVHNASVQYYREETTSGQNCTFSTFSEYTRCRMREGNGKLYGHFADRRWVNQWRRITCCGAHAPTLLNYFPAVDVERTERCLQQFVAPAGGAVIKFNHKAGSVTVLKEGTRLSKEQIILYLKGMKTDYHMSHVEPHYRYAEKGIVIEELLPTDNAGMLPMDYKFFVSDGQVPIVIVMNGRKFQEEGGTLSVFSGPRLCLVQAWGFRPQLLTDATANLSHITSSQMIWSYGTPENFTFEKPCGWDKMLKIAECISKGIPGFRLDLYLIKCKTYISEVTMTSEAGKAKPGREHIDQLVGSFISRAMPLEGTIRRHHLKAGC